MGRLGSPKMDPRTTLGLCRHAVSVRPSICLSVTFVDFVEMNKHIFKKNLPSDIATPFYCSFSISNAMAIFIRGSPIIGPYRGVECRWGRKNCDSRRISGYRIDDWWSANNNCDGPPCSLPHRRPSRISESCLLQTAAWTITTKRRGQSRM